MVQYPRNMLEIIMLHRHVIHKYPIKLREQEPGSARIHDKYYSSLYLEGICTASPLGGLTAGFEPSYHLGHPSGGMVTLHCKIVATISRQTPQGHDFVDFRGPGKGCFSSLGQASIEPNPARNEAAQISSGNLLTKPYLVLV